MKCEHAKSIDVQIRYEIISWCKDCEYYKGKCTKKVAIRVCKKEKIKLGKNINGINRKTNK